MPLHSGHYNSTGKTGTTGGGGTGGGTLPTGAAPLTIGPFNRIFFDDFLTNVAEGAMINSSGVGLGSYSNWGAYATNTKDTSGNNNHTNSGYDNSILSVSGSAMRMRCSTRSDGFQRGAAPYPKLPGLSDCRQTYGRVETRMRCATPVQGFKTAWLRWATSYDLSSGTPGRTVWPASGETDFPEGNLNSNIGAFMHWYGATSGGQQDGYSSATTYTSWHTFVDEWTPGDWKFYIDGTLFGHSTGSHVPSIQMRWLMQTETVLSSSNRPIAGQECVVETDYVAIYGYNP